MFNIYALLLIFFHFAFNDAFGLEVKSCLVLDVDRKSFSAKKYSLKKDGSYLALGKKVWFFSSINSFERGDRIGHLWIRGDKRIDYIPRIVKTGNGLYSYKVLNQSKLGSWSVKTVNQEGEILDHSFFEIKYKSGSFYISPENNKEACERKKSQIIKNESLSESKHVNIEAHPIGKHDNWFFGGGIGASFPLGEMSHYLSSGGGFEFFVGKYFEFLGKNSSLDFSASNFSFSRSSGPKMSQLSDSSILLNYSRLWRINDISLLSVSGGVGQTFWKLNAENTELDNELESTGQDTVFSLGTKYRYQFNKQYHFYLKWTLRQVFGDYSENHMPVSAGLEYNLK